VSDEIKNRDAASIFRSIEPSPSGGILVGKQRSPLGIVVAHVEHLERRVHDLERKVQVLNDWAQEQFDSAHDEPLTDEEERMVDRAYSDYLKDAIAERDAARSQEVRDAGAAESKEDQSG